MRITDTHIYFWGSYLSNWIPNDLTIPYEGHIFTNSEQLFMYLKAKFFKDENSASNIVQFGFDPKTAKDLGRTVKNYDETIWSKYRENAMYIAIRAKFESSPKLRKQLLETGDKILVEGTPFDPIWGVKIKWDDDRILDEKNWNGLNLLGKVLMRVRFDLK
jgi:hypothetical protein